MHVMINNHLIDVYYINNVGTWYVSISLGKIKERFDSKWDYTLLTCHVLDSLDSSCSSYHFNKHKNRRKINSANAQGWKCNLKYRDKSLLHRFGSSGSASTPLTKSQNLPTYQVSITYRHVFIRPHHPSCSVTSLFRFCFLYFLTSFSCLL